MAMMAVPPPQMIVATGPQSWTDGLCGCCSDCGTCCYGIWMLPCLYGDNVDRITKTGCCGPCCLYFWCGHLASCCFAASFRQQLRQKYNLTEEPCSDCCIHCWCSPLAVCQEAREIKRRGN